MTLPAQMHPAFSAPPVSAPFVTADRLARLLEIEATLERISSTSPALADAGSPREAKCALCHALIDEARDVLGYERWPAIPHTRRPFTHTAQFQRPKE